MKPYYAKRPRTEPPELQPIEPPEYLYFVQDIGKEFKLNRTRVLRRTAKRLIVERCSATKFNTHIEPGQYVLYATAEAAIAAWRKDTSRRVIALRATADRLEAQVNGPVPQLWDRS